MTNHTLTFVLAAIIMTIPFKVSATSIYDYNIEKTPEDQTVVLDDAIMSVMSSANKTNPKLSMAIYQYFTMPPQGKTIATGIIAFRVKLSQVEQGSKTGKFDLKVVQLEDLIQAIVNTDVLPTLK